MKKSKITISLVMLIMVSLITASCSAAGKIGSDANDDSLNTKNTITVAGTASITASPTIAYVNIGVATFDKDASVAQSDNATKMDQVYKTLDGLGIPKEKIKTVSYYINPRYDYSTDNNGILSGYDVTNGIEVTVTDLTKVSKVLDMTVEQGINQANSITFSITDEENSKIYNEALADAVANAKEKAGVLATAAGLKISNPLQIIEGSQASTIPVYSYISGAGKATDSAAATPISGGELTVEANVTLVYGY